jgi:exopolysaccharide production protein ExoQ
MTAISVALAVHDRSRLDRLTLPPPNLSRRVSCVCWSKRPVGFHTERSFIRFFQQVMIVASIVLPAMLATRTADMVRGLNVFFVLGGSATIARYRSMVVNIGYPGYFPGKNFI